MEKKTIGGLIAALRKANGMTQKDLAEKLNVSDKSVSRWERDDGAPDLSLIPVIAEIFGVTCDELLRGERRPPEERAVETEEPEGYTPKAEKQRQRLLKICLSQYKSRSIVSVGIALTGVIAAMVGNFAITRAYLGFLVGAVFYLAAAVCQAVFFNSALLSVSDESVTEAELGRYKYSVLRWAEFVYGVILILCAASLPLILMPHTAYVGLSMGSWGRSALVYGGAVLLVLLAVCFFLNMALLNRGYYSRPDEARYRYNHRVKRICVLVLLGLYALTFFGHYAATGGFDKYSLAEAIVFEDYESFITFMEQDVPYEETHYAASEAPATTIVEIPVGEEIYYNEYGQVITEEEARTRELRNRQGELLCTYVQRNDMVARIRYGGGESMLPISVVTFDALPQAGAELLWRNSLFVIGYGLELVGVVLAYFRKRQK